MKIAPVIKLAGIIKINVAGIKRMPPIKSPMRKPPAILIPIAIHKKAIRSIVTVPNRSEVSWLQM